MTRALRKLLLVLLGLWWTQSFAVEVQQWERLPLAVPLVVGQERVLMLDEDVRVGVPGSIANKLRVQSAGGTVYLLAAEPIPPSRLQLQSVKSGDLVLIDIEATSGDHALEPVKIVTATAPAAADEAKNAAPTAPTPIPVVLTRYAAQNLYAPLRTVAPLPGVRRVPVSASPALATLLPTEPVKVSSLAAWRLGEYCVTAVKLVNQGTGTVQLDPRHLQAELFAATFQHDTLGPAGMPEDTTVAYLVTRGKGLHAALLLSPPPQPEHPDHEG